MHVLAHDLTDGRWVATGGGGYQWARVVPARLDALVRRDGRRRRRSGRRAPPGLGPARAGALGRSGAGHLRGPAAGSLARGRGGGADRPGRLGHTGRLMARTKLICTLGPASATPKLVEGLVRAGTSVFRLNFSHGDPDGHARMVELVRGAERSVGRPLADPRRSPRTQGAARRPGARPVPVQAGAALRPAPRRCGRRARRGHDVPGARPGPADRGPGAARRRRGRAERGRDRRGGRADRVRARRHGPQRSRRERPRRTPQPAGGDRPRPRGPGARARPGRRSHRPVVRPIAGGRARAARRHGGPDRPDRGEDRDPSRRRGRRPDPRRGRRPDDRAGRPRRRAADGGDPAHPEGPRPQGPGGRPSRDRGDPDARVDDLGAAPHPRRDDRRGERRPRRRGRRDAVGRDGGRRATRSNRPRPRPRSRRTSRPGARRSAGPIRLRAR